MSNTENEWLSSFAAMQMLRGAGVVSPISMLTQLAEARQVRARASWGRFDNEGEEQEFPREPRVDPKSGVLVSPWPDIPADFWRWVNAGSPGSEVHGEAGVFAATVFYDPELGEASDKEHIKLFGVSFSSKDLTAVLRGVPQFHETPALTGATRSSAGRKQETDRWVDFGAALAFVAYDKGLDVMASDNALYEAVAGALTASRRNPLSKKRVIAMVKNARCWVDAGEIPEDFRNSKPEASPTT